ncbi:MAG: VWA domain-containing protein [Bacteroidetes bacterium]|nr:VWA domain-containing protein [Bacteroidota bacterium]
MSEIVVVLDRSGSMGSIKGATIEGFNAFVGEQQAVPGEAAFTLIQFDSVDPHGVTFDRIALTDMPYLTLNDYQPRGSTPLYDALGKAIDAVGAKLDSLPEEEKPEHVIFAILTDGIENASREWTKEGIFIKVREQQEKWGWKFVYLGANQDAMAESWTIGIHYDAAANNVGTYAATNEGVRKAFGFSGRSVTRYRTGA